MSVNTSIETNQATLSNGNSYCSVLSNGNPYCSVLSNGNPYCSVLSNGNPYCLYIIIGHNPASFDALVTFTVY